MDPIELAPAGNGTRSKAQWRRELRTERRRRYEGVDGAARRANEGQALLSHGAALLTGHTPLAGTSGEVRVGAFHPTPGEPDLFPLLRQLLDEGAQLLFPAADGPELAWISWDGSSAFHASPGRGFGMEPPGPRSGPEVLATIDLLLVPALAIDRSGTRLGHGGGYYDRVLPRLGDDAEVVGVVHPHELLEARALPRESWDHPVPRVLTAAGSSRVGTHSGPGDPTDAPQS